MRQISKVENIRIIYDNDVSVLIGNSIDELMRHHPSLKDAIFKAIFELIETVKQHGKLITEDDKQYCEIVNQNYPKSTGTSSMTQFVDVIGRV